MKSITKLIRIIALAVVIVFSITACDTDNTSEIDGITRFNGALSVTNYQVWQSATNERRIRISDAYHECPESRTTNAYVAEEIEIDTEPWVSVIFVEVDGFSGVIEGGILDFIVPALDETQLLEWDAITWYFFREWDQRDAIAVIPTEDFAVKGNNIIFVTGNDMLFMERLVGTNSSPGLESIYFMYVNQPCTVIGEPVEGTRGENSFYSLRPFSISLTKGWNAIGKTTTYSQSGRVTISLRSVNSLNGFKWVIYSDAAVPIVGYTNQHAQL
jgi:hypothetical protein